METNKTHWRKNIDTRYISGEDLQCELNGLKKDFTVKLVSFDDGETYDQSNQQKSIKTVLYFEDMQGNKLKKGVLLNKTNAKVFESITNSSWIDDWVGTILNIYAQPDKRFGFVVRFKKYIEPPIDLTEAKKKLNNANNIDELAMAWTTLSQKEQKNPVIVELKETLKSKLK